MGIQDQVRKDVVRQPRGADGGTAVGSASLDLPGAESGINEQSSKLKQVSVSGAKLVPGERWFAVQTQPQRETGAAMQLRNQGFQAFLPLRAKTWRHARRIETRFVPLFPGYLFIVLNLDRDRWLCVNSTFGVQRLVMSGEGRPTPVPQGIVEAVLAEADGRGCLRPDGLLRVGQSVRILAGPFGDQIGELVHLDDAGRVRVLIKLLGGRVPVRLGRGLVVAAG